MNTTTILPPGAPRPQWLKARQAGIGGSDIAAIARLSPYNGPLKIYLDKTADDLGPDNPPSEGAMWGTLLEPVVADYFARITGCELVSAGMLAHPEQPWMLANTDRLILERDVEEDRVVGVYEGKTGNAFDRKDWSEAAGRVPDDYLAQIQWYLGVTGLTDGWIAALLGGQHFVAIPVTRDDEIIATLTRLGREFWDRVQERRPPPLDGEPPAAVRSLLDRLYPRSVTGKVVDLKPDLQDIIRQRRLFKQAATEATQRATELENQIRDALGDAEVGTIDGRPAVTRRLVHRKEHTVPATTTFPLRTMRWAETAESENP